jgi:hypothetical protein
MIQKPLFKKPLFLFFLTFTSVLLFVTVGLKLPLCHAETRAKEIPLVKGDVYGSFLVKKALFIPELNVHLTELECTKNGAQVVHIGNDDAENMFSISFRTFPTSSNGAAHILEHTTLKGSKKYPTGNPFQEMTKRLNLSRFYLLLCGL